MRHKDSARKGDENIMKNGINCACEVTLLMP